ncbi:hypothetical protein NHX12_013969 [Muraenolepis orangiensis]|uniref:Uncharacterized protein n=1 Tax=Muraenolepis orangiensis TaxID=630683 RepID=A0A9Q0DAM3_9TELE|nr:hypothetical protein NHX12_013609 [Muraenolepis orangiensis]KAJ3585248.1 hypothetical protein NHX12_013969 [Muraenolepis orangiensis]
MASSETPPLSIRHGIRVAPDVTVEQVLLAVGQQIGYDKLACASRMNKAVVVFLKEIDAGSQIVESGVVFRDSLLFVSPLALPFSRVTVSGVLPFIANVALEQELRRFGKFASAFKTITLGCKDPNLTHVQSLCRHVFMFLENPSQTLDVSFKV